MHRTLGSLVMACLLITPCLAAGKKAGSDGASSLFPADLRLAHAVTLRRPRVYLGELLEELSRTSKVRLRVDEQKVPVSGIDLTVFLKSRPLREVMGGLKEVFSQPSNQWEWQRDGDDYVLRYQVTPEEGALLARRAVFSQWSQDLRTYRGIADLTEVERAAKARTRLDLFPGGQVMEGRMALVRKLSAPDLERLLKGVDVPLSRSGLTPVEAEALRLGVSGGTESLDGSAGIFVDWRTGSLAPTLWIRSGGVAGSAMGGVSWENHWLRKQSAGWQLPSDPEAQRFLEQQAKGDPEVGQPLVVKNLPEWLKKASETQGLQLIADSVALSAHSAWLGRTPEQTVQALVLWHPLTARKYGDIHLLRHRSVVVDPRRGLVPWQFIKELRAVADRNSGYLGFPELLQMGELRPEQVDNLRAEFPDAEPVRINDWRPILRFYLNLLPQSQRQLASDEGLPYRDAGLVARAALTETGDDRGVVGVSRLRDFPREAIVSLRMEQVARRPRMIEGHDVGASTTRTVSTLVWTIRIAGQRDFRQTFPLEPRRPLEPAAD